MMRIEFCATILSTKNCHCEEQLRFVKVTRQSMPGNENRVSYDLRIGQAY